MKNEDLERFYTVVLNGQPCIHDTAKKRLYVWIKKGAYLSVGRGKWPGSPAGFTLNREVLKYAITRKLDICVINGDTLDRAYIVNAETWLNFSLLNHAVVHRKGVALYCYPWNKMVSVKDRDIPRVIKILRSGENG